LVFPAPPSTLGRHRLGPRGLPGRASLPSPKLGDVGRRGLRVSFRALLTRLEPLATPAEADAVGSSSHGITRFAPLHRSTVRASTPGGSEELPSGRRYHPTTSCSAPVVSHHLGGLLRATAAGLLHPAAGHEVHRVSRCVRPKLPKVLRPVSPFPATRFIPFEGFPSPVAVPHHCGRCPPAVGRRPPRPYPGSDETPGPASTRTPKCAGTRSAAPTEAGVAACRLRRDGSGDRTEPRPKPPLELTLLRGGGLPSTRADRGRCEYLTAAPRRVGGTKVRASAR